jgi:hypothetical protein
VSAGAALGLAPEDAGLSGGAIAGIVVGVVVAVAAAAAAAAVAVKQHLHATALRALTQHPPGLGAGQ